MHTEQLLKLVGDLREYDHSFISPEGARHFSEPFGFTARTHVELDSRAQIKGLTIHDGSPAAEGVAAEDLARQICDHLKVAYPPMMGRGFALRSCCDALEQYLKALTAA